jgi:hypothetical protein
MSEQEFELYLRLLSRCLSLTSQQREQISDELRDHLEERLDELARAGVPREKAVFQALDEFGDAAVLAAHFTTIAQLKRRRFLMRLSLGSVAALAAALLVAFAFWPENRAMQGPAPLFAQNKANLLGSASPRPAHAPSTSPTTSPAPTEHPLSSDVGEHPKIEAALDSTTEFTIDPQPLKDAIDFIATRYSIPIILDSKALEDASVDTNTEVKLAVKGLKLRQSMTLLLQQLPTPLAFDIQDGVLRISTIEKINEHLTVVVYDCRDLIHLRSIYPGADVRSSITTSQEGEAAAAVDVSSTPAAKPTQPDASGPVKHPAKGAHSAKVAHPQSEIPLIRVIRYAGSADDWSEGEGGGPKITELGGLLVVNQNPIVHEQIKRILADLRRMRKEGAFTSLDKDHGNLLDKDRSAPPTTSSQPGAAKGF